MNNYKIDLLIEKLKNNTLKIADLEESKTDKKIFIEEDKIYRVRDLMLSVTEKQRFTLYSEIKTLSKYIYVKLINGKTKKILSKNIIKTLRCFRDSENIKLIHDNKGFNIELVK